MLITGVIETKQKRDVMTLDIPNAFVQTAVPQGKTDEEIIMKIRGPLVDMLIDIYPGKYEEFIVYERNKKSVVRKTAESAIRNAQSLHFVLQEV